MYICCAAIFLNPGSMGAAAACRTEIIIRMTHVISHFDIDPSAVSDFVVRLFRTALLFSASVRILSQVSTFCFSHELNNRTSFPPRDIVSVSHYCFGGVDDTVCVGSGDEDQWHLWTANSANFTTLARSLQLPSIAPTPPTD